MDDSDRYAAFRSALEDRYVFERRLGRGGMATVYLAQDKRYGRHVALKVLRPEIAALGPTRFLREIEIVAQLSHPHILPMHEAGEAAGLLYYTMPYVQGESLRDRLKREECLPIDEALHIADEVADALGYAHSQGIVHRDIKPANILLQGSHALVADFGIARAIAIAADERMTDSGVSLGTPAYMSPEQASEDQAVDARSDLYSLGCVLYEMLAGDPPFTGSRSQVVLARKLAEPAPRVRTVRPTVPEALDRAIARATATTPADRFERLEDFRAALRTTPAPTVGLRGWFEELKRRRVIGVSVVYVVAAVAIVEGVDVFKAGLGLPEWTTDFLAGVAVCALPLVLVLAWAFDITASGIQWTRSRRHSGRERVGPLAKLGRAAAISAVALFTLAGSVLSWQRATNAEAVTPSRVTLDPTRVAILPFQVVEGGEDVSRFAVNLTTRLIEGLSAIEVLSMLSWGAVLPYGGGNVPIDSVARAIGAGTLVTGLLEMYGDSLRARVQLIDGETGEQIGANVAEAWFTERLRLVDAAADTITLLLRQALGLSIQRRQRLLQTNVQAAFDAVERATALRDEFHEAVKSETRLGEAERLAAQIDSLLQVAETRDPEWIEPVISRAEWSDHRKMLLTAQGTDTEPLLREGMRHAERALGMQAGHPDALEIRGKLRKALAGVVRASDPDEAERLLEGAESDLRRAIDGNPTPAGALRALSELMEDRGRTAEAIVYAQRAWERDPFYDQADVIPRRLYEYFFRLAQDDDAQTWCETGRDRFKDLPVYSDCRLQLLAWAEVYPPDIDEAWNLVETLLDMSAPSFRPLIANRLPLVVAGVIVRAATDAAAAIDSTVLADSARSILRSAQARGLANGGEVMAYAAVLDRLGDRDQAIATIRSYLNEHPEHASLFARARELRPLRADPAFIELIGERPIAGPPD